MFFWGCAVLTFFGSGLAENQTEELHLACSEQFCLPHGYENVQPPVLKDGSPLNIDVEFLITEVMEVIDKDFRMGLQMELTASWEEPRMVFTGNKSNIPGMTTLGPELINKLWLPDIFIHKLYRIVNNRLFKSFKGLYIRLFSIQKIFCIKIVQYDFQVFGFLTGNIYPIVSISMLTFTARWNFQIIRSTNRCLINVSKKKLSTSLTSFFKSRPVSYLWPAMLMTRRELSSIQLLQNFLEMKV